MKKYMFSMLALFSLVLKASAQDITYHILSECDTTVKAKIEGITLGSREVRHFVYEYPSKDADGNPVTISGIVMVPGNVADGSVPCDGIILFNHHTIGNPSQAPSQGELDVPSGMLANPLKPNYIIVMCDYIGYGSSIDHPISYLCGDTNARNSLDGLLAARRMLTDKNISLGKYMFNMGYSQGGTESMYIAKLRDMEYKDKGITFDKTFAGGGMLDCEKAYSEFVRKDACDNINDVVMFLISANENCHFGIDYKDLFQEPLASNVLEFIETKDKSVLSRLGVNDLDSLHQLIKPAFMDLTSDQCKALLAKLAEIKITNGWEPDLTQKYYIEHSRHDNYVPIQCSREMISWMKDKGFVPSIVPGKTTLQTNTMVFKLKHQPSAIVWFIQSMAAIQYWPVIYYEGEQNRYFHDVVHDLNLMKLIKYIEGWGIDLRALVSTMSSSRSFEEELSAAIEDGSVNPEGSISQLARAPRHDFFDVLDKITNALAKVDLTLTDAYEMLDDAGISLLDIMEVYNYLTSTPEPAAQQNVLFSEEIEAPVYLLRQYEQTLANWFLLGGIDVEYDKWGW